MVIYGGDGESETLGDFHIFDANLSKWSTPINCSSAPRAWHTMAYLPDKHLLLVFGGERADVVPDGTPEILSNIMVMDTQALLWYPPAVSGYVSLSLSRSLNP
jgi:hypothetical protein